LFEGFDRSIVLIQEKGIKMPTATTATDTARESQANQEEQESKTRLVWFQILDKTTGEPYKGIGADFVPMRDSADVCDLRKAVRQEHSHRIKRVATSQLRVYRNQAAFDMRNETGEEGTLKLSSLVDGLGICEAEAVIMAVPSVKDCQ
jgi:hypothetical protein